MKNPSLIYVADPMCSWCWGFSPVFEELMQRYQDLVTIRIVLGGLRPGNTQPFDEQKRTSILSHWHAVHERTGQPFNFALHMGPLFTYDTEPSSRAVILVRQLAPVKEFKFLKSVQRAFYVDNLDVTHEKTLAGLAEAQDIARELFLKLFHDPALKESVRAEFDQARQLGVSGFLTLLRRYGRELVGFTHGYQSASVVIPLIDDWLHR
jgi:putative protein-disulfide isomerase